MILPTRPRRADLASFGLAGTLVAAAVVVTVGLFTSSARWALAGVPVACVPGLLALLRPQALLLPYRAWNKLARYSARVTRVTLKTVCYYVVILAAARRVGRLALSRPAAATSLWVPRQAPGRGIDVLGSADVMRTGNWIREYVSWATAGNVWALSLLPFLVVLSVVESYDDGAVPGDVYTLY